MRHPDGIREMLGQLRLHFRVPPERDVSGRRKKQLFQRFILLSQACTSFRPSSCTPLHVQQQQQWDSS